MKRLLLNLISAIALCSTWLGVSADEVTQADFAFLAGMWRGTGFGGHSEEIWMPPSNGRVFGIFTQSNDGELVFSEYMEITKQEEEWVLRLKHFNPDFSGWEEKTDYVTFHLRSVAKNEAVFGGLSYKVVGDDLTVSLRLQQDDGSITTETFNFTRVEL